LLGLFIIFTYLAVSERLLALFLAPIVALYLLLLVVAGRPKPVGLRRRNLLLILAPGFAFLLLELYKFLTTGVPTLVYEGQFFAGQANHSPARLLLSIGFRLGIPLICLGLVGGFYLLIEQTRLGLFLCLAAGTPILLLLIIAPFAFTVDRYVFFILPFWAILTAVALTRLFAQANQYGKLLPLGVLALVLAVLMGENLLYFQYQNGNRPDWRAAFAVVEQQRQPGDIVLATRPEVGHFYLSPAVGALPKAAGNDITQLGERIWFVLDEATSPVNPALLAWLQQNSRLVEIVPVYMAGKSLTIRIYLFDSTP
jgi:hypothetical protein